MKFFSSTIASAILTLLPAISAVQLQYDAAYDNSGQSMNTVACSDGSNGLASRYSTFGSVPSRVAAADVIGGWNSPNCGACFRLSYTSGGTTRSINVVAVDVAGSGFNVGKNAMDELTNGQAVALGKIDVQSERLSSSDCGL
ncbi:hypothetical protein V5O48_001630 [Marasmius crinis-equi]|uniref:Uncharacterized protein n=1 Tax=Marasmius crinis-equi TaxID=585013 RepID=A0ABR3FXW1_9AGAR